MHVNFETTRKRIVLFSSISLTDIVLLLLIFFLLSSSYIVQPGIKVSLPKAVTGQADQDNRIFLTVTREGRIYLNSRPVSYDEVSTELARLIEQNPGQLVVIKADKDLTLERTVEIIDLAKLAGADKFMIATQPGL